MKLKEFNAENTMSLRSEKPSLHINTKTGLFSFNKAACDKLGLVDGDQVTFHQDEEDPGDWYIRTLGKTGKGFALRAKENVSKGLLFNNTSMARALVFSIQDGLLSCRIPLASEATKDGKSTYWALMTAALNKEEE